MNNGKAPENVLKRSVIKNIKSKRSEVLTNVGVGVDCAVLEFESDSLICVASNPVTVSFKGMGALSVNSSVNNLATIGAEGVGINVNILAPCDFEESDLKALMDEIKEAAKGLNVDILGGHTEFTDAVNEAIVTITAIGKKAAAAYNKDAKANPGDDVVITKWIGLGGTYAFAVSKEEELLKRFPPKMIYDASNFLKYLSVVPEAAVATKSGVTSMHDISKGGVFAALWELASHSGVGLKLNMKDIPLKQETVEICNFLNANPYELESCGSMLMTTPDGNKLVLELEEAGIHATVVGKVTDSNDRILVTEDRLRYLDLPAPCELNRVLGFKKEEK